MGKWAFVSDFDGTITNKDFYWEVIDHCYPEGKELYKQWKACEIKDIDFLSQVFQSINLDEAMLIQMIQAMSIDGEVLEFIKQVQKAGGDFIILSAGTDYYIKQFINHYNIEDVDVFANSGYFENRNIHLNIDTARPFYSERYGIDKAKVIQYLKQWYDVIYFIGDSDPDVHAAIYADVNFAKGDLQTMLDEKGISNQPVESFKQVKKFVQEIK